MRRTCTDSNSSVQSSLFCSIPIFAATGRVCLLSTMSLDPRRRPAQQQQPPPPPAAVPDSTAMKVEVVPERPATTTPSNEAQDDSFKLKFCTVCASNNNRYISPHLITGLALPQRVICNSYASLLVSLDLCSSRSLRTWHVPEYPTFDCLSFL